MVLISPMKVTSSLIEEWVKNGLVSKLEAAVLQGHSEMLSNIGKVWNEESRNFIKRVPDLKVILAMDLSFIKILIYRSK